MDRERLWKRNFKAIANFLDRAQAKKPDHLVSVKYFADNYARKRDLTTQTARWQLTEAVHHGHVLEILVRRDRLIVWPGENSLPDLYAVEDAEQLYLLSPDRPKSRGSDGVSFLMTPMVYKAFVERKRAELRSSELA